MRGDDRETLRLSQDKAGGVDTEKKKTIAKNNIWQKILFSPCREQTIITIP